MTAGRTPFLFSDLGVTAQPAPLEFGFLSLAFALCQCPNSTVARHLLSACQEAFVCHFPGLPVLLFLRRKLRTVAVDLADNYREVSNCSRFIVPLLVDTALVSRGIHVGFFPPFRLNYSSWQSPADSLPSPACLRGVRCDAESLNAFFDSHIDSSNSVSGQQPHRCLVCDTTSTESCHCCGQDFCRTHLYPCIDCGIRFCGACLEDHHADGHWSDSDTSAELVRSQSIGISNSHAACSSHVSGLADAHINAFSLLTTLSLAFTSLLAFVFSKHLVVLHEVCL